MKAPRMQQNTPTPKEIPNPLILVLMDRLEASRAWELNLGEFFPHANLRDKTSLLIFIIECFPPGERCLQLVHPDSCLTLWKLTYSVTGCRFIFTNLTRRTSLHRHRFCRLCISSHVTCSTFMLRLCCPVSTVLLTLNNHYIQYNMIWCFSW